MIQINIIGLFWNDSSNNVDRIDDLINDDIVLKQSISNSNSDLSLSLSSSRSPDQETEPNNDIFTSISNSNELKDNTDMEGQLTYTSDELDCYYMELTGGGQSSIDSVTITPSFQNNTELHERAVGFKLKAYTMSDSELYILEYKAFGSQWAVNNDSSILWRNATSLLFNADQTGRYFIKLNAVYIKDSGTNQVIDPDVKINYTLQVSISSISNQDNNNDIFNSTMITGPIENKTITQAFDHWDWYEIDTLTQNREVNVSLSLKINHAFNSSTQPPGHYVNLIGVLKCFDLETNSWLKDISFGDSRELENSIYLYLSARFSTVYLGIHSQQLVYDNSWIPDSIDCGDSNLNYDIDSLELTLINTKPKFGSWNATPRKSDVQDSYHFDISYLDVDNDEPFFVNVTIDNVNYTLSKSSVPSNDGDYTNGECYEVTVPGTSFSDIPHDSFKKLGFSFSTQDYFTELSLPMKYVSLNSQTYIEVIDNVVPIVRSSVPDNWSIKEDSSPVYINLFDKYLLSHCQEGKKDYLLLMRIGN